MAHVISTSLYRLLAKKWKRPARAIRVMSFVVCFLLLGFLALFIMVLNVPYGH